MLLTTLRLWLLRPITSTAIRTTSGIDHLVLISTVLSTIQSLAKVEPAALAPASMAVVRPTTRGDVQFVHVIGLSAGGFGTEGTFRQNDVGGSLAVRFDRGGAIAVGGVQYVGRFALRDDAFGRHVEGMVVTGDKDLGSDLGVLMMTRDTGKP